MFLGLFGIVFTMLGGWAGWMLGGNLRTPWTWAAQLLYYGGDGVRVRILGASGWQRWKRLWLVAYWAATIVVAVGGWQTRLVRARRINMGRSHVTDKKQVEKGTKIGAETAREEKRVHASLNMRRKFFHALAVIMFVPGIAVDVSRPICSFAVLHISLTVSIANLNTACLHLDRVLCRFRAVHLLRVRSVLCAVPDWRAASYLLQRVHRFQRRRM